MSRKSAKKKKKRISVPEGYALIIPEANVRELIRAVESIREMQGALERLQESVAADTIFTRLDLLGLPQGGPYYFLHTHFGEGEKRLAGIAFTEKAPIVCLIEAIKSLKVIQTELLRPDAPEGAPKGINIVLGGWNDRELLKQPVVKKVLRRKPVIHTHTPELTYNILLHAQAMTGSGVAVTGLRQAVTEAMGDIFRLVRSRVN